MDMARRGAGVPRHSCPMTSRAPLPPSLGPDSFTTSEALATGVSRSRLRAQDLDSPFHGVRLDASAPATLETLCRARALLLPSDAFISGVTAAVLRRVPLPRPLESATTIHITVPEGRRALSGRGVHGHAARVGPDDVVDWRGLRISSAPRVWCELASTLSLPDLVAAGDYLVCRELPHTTVASLAAAVEAYPARPGAARLRKAIGLLDDNSASRRESLLRVLAQQQGFTGFRTNMRIRTASGHTYFGDLVFLEERVILEYQSEYHFDLDQQRKDMTRRSRLEADNWAVMFVNSNDLDNPQELASRIRAVMANHSRQLASA